MPSISKDDLSFWEEVEQTKSLHSGSSCRINTSTKIHNASKVDNYRLTQIDWRYWNKFLNFLKTIFFNHILFTLLFTNEHFSIPVNKFLKTNFQQREKNTTHVLPSSLQDDARSDLSQPPKSDHIWTFHVPPAKCSYNNNIPFWFTSW